MGEIKSTLDLVMERTRHLTLTEAEKREQALSEFKKNLSGLLMKFQDGLLSLDQVHEELKTLQQKAGFTDAKIVVAEVLKRLDLDQDNERLLTLVEKLYDLDTAAIALILQSYHDTLATSAGNRAQVIKANLTRLSGIAGSAVLPNLEADSDWAVERASIRTQFGAKLAQESAQLTASASS